MLSNSMVKSVMTASPPAEFIEPWATSQGTLLMSAVCQWYVNQLLLYFEPLADSLHFLTLFFRGRSFVFITLQALSRKRPGGIPTSNKSHEGKLSGIKMLVADHKSAESGVYALRQH